MYKYYTLYINANVNVVNSDDNFIENSYSRIIKYYDACQGMYITVIRRYTYIEKIIVCCILNNFTRHVPYLTILYAHQQ